MPQPYVLVVGRGAEGASRPGLARRQPLQPAGRIHARPALTELPEAFDQPEEARVGVRDLA